MITNSLKMSQKKCVVREAEQTAYTLAQLIDSHNFNLFQLYQDYKELMDDLISKISVIYPDVESDLEPDPNKTITNFSSINSLMYHIHQEKSEDIKKEYIESLLETIRYKQFYMYEEEAEDYIRTQYNRLQQDQKEQIINYFKYQTRS